MISLIDDVTVIIRSVGERTEAACKASLQKQIPEANLVIICECPFSKALALGYHIGLKRGLPWTLHIDADVVLKEDAVSTLRTAAETAPPAAFEIQGLVLDRFLGGPRAAGNHFYRTAHLEKGLTYIAEGEAVSMRPESHVMYTMADNGFPWIQHDFILGIHDYEQYHRDIYRKAFVHACKHGRFLRQLESMWLRLGKQNDDFQTALWGLKASRIYDKAVDLNVQIFPQQVEHLLQLEGRKEKNTLPKEQLAPDKINDFLSNITPEAEFIEIKKMMGNKHKHCNPEESLLNRTRAALKQTGWLGLLPFIAGKGLEKAGKHLQAWSKSND